jgi:hypothetical protein
VGGYLLGGGLNALGVTSLYGLGAVKVITYKLVLGEGRLATVDKDHIKIRNDDGTTRTILSTGDLWFALHGAETCFGIVTEFLYTLQRTPKTLPIAIPIVLETENDFKRLENAAQNTKWYLFAAYSYRRYNKGILPYNLFQFNLPFVSMLLMNCLLKFLFKVPTC